MGADPIHLLIPGYDDSIDVMLGQQGHGVTGLYLRAIPYHRTILRGPTYHRVYQRPLGGTEATMRLVGFRCFALGVDMM